MDGTGPLCSLGAAIKARRQELGWSQEELAARVVVQGDATFRQSDVSRLERGKVDLPHRERLGHIAAVLGLSLGELLARSGWAGADLAFVETKVPAVDHGPEAPITMPSPRPVHVTPASARSEQSSRLREVLAQAQATRERTLQILAQCEQMRALYDRPMRTREQQA